MHFSLHRLVPCCQPLASLRVGLVRNVSLRQDGYTLEGTSTRVCANGGNWTGENNAVCTGNSLFRFTFSSCRFFWKEEICFASATWNGIAKTLVWNSVWTSVNLYSFFLLRNRGFNIIFHGHHVFFFKLTVNPLFFFKLTLNPLSTVSFRSFFPDV